MTLRSHKWQAASIQCEFWIFLLYCKQCLLIIFQWIRLVGSPHAVIHTPIEETVYQFFDIIIKPKLLGHWNSKELPGCSSPIRSPNQIPIGIKISKTTDAVALPQMTLFTAGFPQSTLAINKCKLICHSLSVTYSHFLIPVMRILD